MKKLSLILMLCLSSLCLADYLGSWKIGDYVPIPANTHRFTTGGVYAPTVLTYSIYEDGNTVGLYENVDMVVASPFDGVVGFYLARRQLTSAAGFEKGKNYTVLVKATVDSVSATVSHTFQINAAVDVNTVCGEVPFNNELDAVIAKDSNGVELATHQDATAILAGELSADDIVDELLTGHDILFSLSYWIKRAATGGGIPW